MKNIFYCLILILIASCSMDNKSYPIELKSITKKENNYQIVVSSEIDLNEIKSSHHFTTERFVADLKNKKFDQQDFVFEGSFHTENQQKINNLYYYTINLKIRNKKGLNKLTPNDTIKGYLQLSYHNGRTYPTKSIEIPASKILDLK